MDSQHYTGEKNNLAAAALPVSLHCVNKSAEWLYLMRLGGLGSLCREALQYFIANDINDEDTKHAILLSIHGAKTLGLLRYLVAPEKPSAKSFEVLIVIVITIPYHQRLNGFSHPSGISVAVFVTELHCLLKHCNFECCAEEQAGLWHQL